MNIDELKRNSVINKIRRHNLAVYVTVIVLILGTGIFYIIPAMQKVADQNIKNQLELMKDMYNEVQDSCANYVNTLKSMQELKFYLNQGHLEESEEVKSKVSLYLEAFQNIDARILSVLIYDVEKEIPYQSIYFENVQIHGLAAENRYMKRLCEKTENYISPVYTLSFSKKFQEANGAAAVRNQMCFYASSVQVGSNRFIFAIFYSIDDILKDIRKVGLNTVDDFLFSNKKNELVYSTWNGERSREILSSYENRISEKAGIFQGKYIVQELNAYGGVLIGYAGFRTYMGGLFPLLIIILLLLLFPILVIYCVTGHQNRKYLLSLKELAVQMDRFGVGKELPEVLETRDEIEILSRIFYRMAEDMNEKTEEIKKKEREESIAAYKLLAAQLDPHFVSNTMGIINIMARHGQVEDIICLNNALTGILRDRLKLNRSILASVDEEIRMLKDYMVIIRYRYRNQVTVVYDVAEDVCQALILKNVLQLLVENSLFHGLLRNDDEIRGEITVMVYRIEDEITIEVSDDGEGMEQDQVRKLMENQFRTDTVRPGHIGMHNIYQRLQYVYGEDFSMMLQSQRQEGTTVAITIPVSETNIIL